MNNMNQRMSTALAKNDHTIKYLTNQILAGHPQCLLGDRLIDLPVPQRAGTETQKRYYAEMKAGEILANL